VKAALALAYCALATDIAEADVFVLNGEIPEAAVLAGRVKDGAGPALADVRTLLGQAVRLEAAEGAIRLTDARDAKDAQLILARVKLVDG
jgi:hypothetical protein